ncbi:MAG: bb3-type cytochrome oxidase subunit III [Pseudomonadota bacterium]
MHTALPHPHHDTAMTPAEEAALRRRGASTALWLFIAVASVLFTLFFVAYAMRMDQAPDWAPIGMPWQLWLSTALLAAGSGLMHLAGAAAQAQQPQLTRLWLMGGGLAAAAFLGSQLWGWQSLIDQRVMLGSNPASSFFYVLTALHGLHVLGGLVAWSIAAQALALPRAELPGAAWRIRLCARYWHFLLLLWGALFGVLAALTPEIVRWICG